MSINIFSNLDKIEEILSKYTKRNEFRLLPLANMSRTNEVATMLKTIMEDLTKLKVAIKELQEDNASAAVNAEKMYKNLNVKFDMFKNLESQSREMIKEAADKPKRVNKPGFFKMIFTDERDKYMNILYTQEEIDNAYETKEVQAKKKDSERLNKVISTLYTTHIKGNSPEGREAAFNSYYDQYDKSITKPSSA